MASNKWYRKSFGEDYLQVYSHRDEEEAKKEVEKIIALTGAEEDWAILDLCCGAGRHLDALFELGYRNLMGLDLSSDLLQVAGENSPHITFIRGDMRNLPFSEHFHLVLSLFTSFGYFFDDMENLQVLKEIYRCLRPGGKFLIDYINRSYLEENLVPEDIFCINGKKIISKRYFSSDKLRVEKDILVIEGRDRKTYHESVRLFTVAELKNLMEKSGFINIDCHGGLKEDTLPLNSRITLIGKIPAF